MSSFVPTTDQVVAAAVKTADGLAAVTNSLPIVGDIFSVFKAIADMVQGDIKNKETCKKAAIRCQGLECVLWDCSIELCRNVMDDGTEKALSKLLELVTKLKDMVEEHSAIGKFKAVLLVRYH